MKQDEDTKYEMAAEMENSTAAREREGKQVGEGHEGADDANRPAAVLLQGSNRGRLDSDKARDTAELSG